MASNLRVDTILPSTGTTLGIGTASGLVTFLGDTNITTSGALTAGSASITGNLGIGGTLTYEDVTNIDSVGIITARSGIRVGANGLKRETVHLDAGDSGANYLRFTNTTTGNGTTDGFNVGINADEHALLWNFENKDTIFATNNLERLRIDSNGALLLSTAGTRRNTKGSSQYQAFLIEGTTNNTSRMSMIRSSNDDNGPEIQIIKTRGTSVGSVTKPNQNDYLGAFVFLAGDDSDLFTRGAEIGVQATGTPANDRCPSDIIFSTTPTSGASTPQQRLRIASDGSINMGSGAYSGGGADPVLYIVGTSGRQVKIHNTNSATTSLQLTNAVTGQGEDNGLQIAALSNGQGLIHNVEDARIQISSNESTDTSAVATFIKPNGPSGAQTVMIAFESGNQGRGAIKCSSSDGGLPSLVALSDYRIKTNIRDYTSGYDTIKAIPVKLFDMTSDGTKDIKGWIAHEVQDYIPEAVLGDKDAVDSNGNPILQNLGYGSFMPDVVGALQTAIAKIETLEAKVAALEGS